MFDFGLQLSQAPSPLSREDFLFFRERIYSLAGITLNEHKQELVHTRLRFRVQELGLKSYHDYRLYLESLKPDHEEWQLFINRLTTNKTDFFREPKHFDFLLHKYIPDWQKKKKDVLQVWSAACSTGEEPYTLAMVLELAQLKYEIHASDIDSDVLKKAQNAVYPLSKLQNEIPENYFSHFINQGSGHIDSWGRISPRIKKNISFFQHNLIDGSMPFEKASIDVFFLRNVLIYFSPETISLAVENLYQMAAPGALLCIGHSETLNGVKTSWKAVSPSIYTKR